MEQRRFRVGSVFEWLAAALGVVALAWIVSVPIQRMLGPRVEAAIAEQSNDTPPGVPTGAINVPVVLLRDGAEIHQGDLQTRLNEVVPERSADGPAILSRGEFGERRTRAYVVNGARFYVVCERLQPGGPTRIAGIYLP